MVAALMVGAGRIGDLLPSLPNPFGSETVDRTQPTILQSLEDLSRYEAARANFEVIVDSEKDARFIPSVIRGERTLFVGAGSVEATVDFSGLDEGSIRVSDSPTSDRPLYLAAEKKMRAAAGSSDLQARAEDNTRQMLDGTLRALGFTSVTVHFVPNPA